MSIAGFELFENIIAGTDTKAKLKWAQRHRHAILQEIDPITGKNIYEEGYFPLLSESYKYVNKRETTFALNNGKRYTSVAKFYESTGHRIAQVATYPREITSIDGDALTSAERGEVAVATYCDNGNGEVVIVNRFDAVGFEYHDNNYAIYGSLASTYERYFTDGYYNFPSSPTETTLKPYAKLPHLHFQSPAQTAAMGQEKCNAISVDNLLAYLDALQQGTDPIIQNESLGMPFLSYFKNERTYHSSMEQYLKQAKTALIEKGDSCDIPIINYMQQMIDIYQDYDDGGADKRDKSFVTTDDSYHKTYTSTTYPMYHQFDVNGYPAFVAMAGTPEGFDNIRAIQKDLAVAKDMIEHLKDYPNLIAGMADTFMESLSAPQKLDNNEEGMGLEL